MIFSADCPVKTGLIFHLKAEHGTPTNWRAARGSSALAVPNTGTPVASRTAGRRALISTGSNYYRFSVEPPFTDGAVSIYALVGRGLATGGTWGIARNSGGSARGTFNTWADSGGIVANYADNTNKQFRRASPTAVGTTGLIVNTTLIYRGPTLQTHYFGSNGTQITDNATVQITALPPGPTVFFDVGVSTSVYVYEVLIYTGAHDATTRQRVEQYLRFRREGRI